MDVGEKYYMNKPDIQRKKQELEWKTNSKIENAFMRKLVDQKVGYILSKPFTIKCDNKIYQDELNKIFNKYVLKLLKNIGVESINKGIAWMHIYFSDNELKLKKIPSEQVIPIWADYERTELERVVRIYETIEYICDEKNIVTKVEDWSGDGVNYYIYSGNSLTVDSERKSESHFILGNGKYNFEKIPFIPFRYNSMEQPLISMVKSLIDTYNLIDSTDADLLADIPKFIYKLINYGGTNLEEFLRDLNIYKAVKLDDHGDVDKLQAEPNTQATESMLKRIRRSIYEFGRGVDSQNDDVGNASGVALKFRYSDLDMDCNIIETEFQSSLESLMWFIDNYLIYTQKGDFTKEDVSFIFNRDIIISESEVINDCKNSMGIISQETIIANHPFVNDLENELKKINLENEPLGDNYAQEKE